MNIHPNQCVNLRRAYDVDLERDAEDRREAKREAERLFEAHLSECNICTDSVFCDRGQRLLNQI